jgi:multisubunit Na+/H+ antiporter MnhB subunit
MSLKHDKVNFKPNNLILYNVIQGLFFFIILFSLYLFLAGHNAPGGGFIAGLMTAAGIVFLYITFPARFKRKDIVLFKRLIPLGLLCAIGCGLGAIVLGYPFLTQTFAYFDIPLFGEIELATAVIFDLGVYLMVVGGVLTIVISIGSHEHGIRPLERKEVVGDGSSKRPQRHKKKVKSPNKRKGT